MSKHVSQSNVIDNSNVIDVPVTPTVPPVVNNDDSVVSPNRVRGVAQKPVVKSSAVGSVENRNVANDDVSVVNEPDDAV